MAAAANDQQHEPRHQPGQHAVAVAHRHDVTNAGNADNEYGLLLTNVGGTMTLDDMTFNNAGDNLVYLYSTTSSTFNVTGSAFSYPGVVSGTANSAMLAGTERRRQPDRVDHRARRSPTSSVRRRRSAPHAAASGTLSLTFSNNTINSGAGQPESWSVDRS